MSSADIQQIVAIAYPKLSKAQVIAKAKQINQSTNKTKIVAILENVKGDVQ